MKAVRNLFLLLMAGWISCGLGACSDDNGNDAPDNTPGTIAAKGTTQLTSYAAKGIMRIPVSIENPAHMPDPDEFRYAGYQETFTGSLDFVGGANGIAHVSAVERDGGTYLLVMEYDYSAYESTTVTFTLTYPNTDTAIPFTLHIYDGIAISTPHACVGMAGLVMIDKKPANLPDGTADMQVTDLRTQGNHAQHVSFEADKDGTCWHILLSQSFEFDYAETEQGFATIPVTADISCGGQTFTTDATLEVCPARETETVTLTDEDRYQWNLGKEAEALGFPRNEDGYLYFPDTKSVSFYFARKGEPLDDLDNIEPVMFANSGYHQESTSTTDEEGNVTNVVTDAYPVIGLTGIRDLPAGEYVLVAHIRKSADADNRLCADFRLPFVKK